MRLITLLTFICLSLAMYSQDTIKLYNPEADAKADLQNVIALAKEQNKHVLIQIGGNWCPWCVRLHQFILDNPKIDSTLHADYILLRINYSPENRNPEVLAELDYPQRFGFPVLVIVDENGKRLHTQDTWYLELDKSYHPEKLIRFLQNWNREAVDPKNYQ